MTINKQALREAAQEEIMLRSVSDTSDAWQDEASPEAVLALLDELEAEENRIAELETREVMLPTPYRKVTVWLLINITLHWKNVPTQSAPLALA